ncbi:lipase family protein [uncultured Maricaulis sp.]|uniref:lipase family protein n=1 Tax=uncultured Maricaulis sp. TaxID=174710 RepID=UPI0030D96A95|tara:strand:- start:74114 stop:75151 length:1038 start_codon:yes stop_codon:yes gene_type:complete
MPPSDSPILDDIKSAASELIDPVIDALNDNPWPRRLIHACNAAYLIEDRRLASGLPLLDEAGLQKGTRPLVFVSGLHDVHAGFVCRTDDGGLLVTFRGTLPPQDMIFWRWATDWLHDAQTVPMPWTVGEREYGQVASAFGIAVSSLATDLLETLETLNAGSASAIRVTGHSKGGAMACLGATLIRAQYPDRHIEVCSFAAPMTADQDFIDCYNEDGLLARTARFQNALDPVPYLPGGPQVRERVDGDARLDDAKKLMLVEDAIKALPAWPYRQFGHLHFMHEEDGRIQHDEEAENAAWDAIIEAIVKMRFREMIDAHSGAQRYLTSLCPDEGAETEAALEQIKPA